MKQGTSTEFFEELMSLVKEILVSSKSFKGNSIIGDKSYGKSKKKFRKINLEVKKKIDNFGRQALHAKSLGFLHPKNSKEFFFEAKKPKDFETLVKTLKKASL